MMRILLTGGRAPATLDLARILFRQTPYIFLAESLALSLTSFSRCIKKSYRVAAPRQHPDLFAQDILKIIHTHDIDVVIPTCEEIFTVVAYEHLIRPHAHIFAPDHDTLLRLHSKWEFVQWMQKSSLSVPTTQRITQHQTLAHHISQAGATHVYKPEWSRFGSKVQISPSTSTWITDFPCDESYAWLAQERIIGQGWCSYSWFDQGKLLAHSNYPMDFSKSTQASLVFAHHTHAKIEKWVRDFGIKTDYTGQVAFDFIETDDRLYAIECNPRLTSGIHTLFGQDLYALLTAVYDTSPQNDHIETQVTHDSQSDLTQSDLAQLDLATSQIDHHALCVYGRNQPQSLKAVLWLYAFTEILDQGFKRWIWHIWYAQDVLLRWHDPLPGLTWPIGYMQFIWYAWREKISLVEASTFDIEWNSES